MQFEELRDTIRHIRGSGGKLHKSRTSCRQGCSPGNVRGYGRNYACKLTSTECATVEVACPCSSSFLLGLTSQRLSLTHKLGQCPTHRTPRMMPPACQAGTVANVPRVSADCEEPWSSGRRQLNCIWPRVTERRSLLMRWQPCGRQIRSHCRDTYRRRNTSQRWGSTCSLSCNATVGSRRRKRQPYSIGT